MSSTSDPRENKSPQDAAPPPSAESARLGGLSDDLLDEMAENRADEIEMIGEEEALGLSPPGVPRRHPPTITPGLRYLHSSRTIAQLINDRNRAVGMYLAVASLLWTGSAWLLNAQPKGELLVPIDDIKRWCLPYTFFILSALSLVVGLLLIRTRVGLIYEVAKMNALLGLPVGRVQRVNPLSIFSLMHFLVSMAGGLTGALFTYQMTRRPLGHATALPISTGVGIGITLLLVVLYIVMVNVTTAEKKLQDGVSPQTPEPR